MHFADHFPSRYWAACTSAHFAAARAQGLMEHTIAVLPLGATEQHGPHLPLQVDSAIANALVQSAIAALTPTTPALFLPTLPVGYSPEHSSFGGTLTLKAETLLRLWTDVAESAAASGIRKLVLFNTHGGQAGFMDIVGRDLRMRLGLTVYCVNWYQLPLVDTSGEDLAQRFSAHEHRFGAHAGQIETSLMLALHPELVDMGQAQNFASTSEQRAAKFDLLGNGKSAKLAWAAQDYNPAGAMGNAAAATAETGRAVCDAAGAALAKLLAQIAQV